MENFRDIEIPSSQTLTDIVWSMRDQSKIGLQENLRCLNNNPVRSVDVCVDAERGICVSIHLGRTPPPTGESGFAIIGEVGQEPAKSHFQDYPEILKAIILEFF